MPRPTGSLAWLLSFTTGCVARAMAVISWPAPASRCGLAPPPVGTGSVSLQESGLPSPRRPQSRVLLLELLSQTLLGAGGEDAQLIERQVTIEPQEVKQGLQRTEDRRFPLPDSHCIHLDRNTIIHLLPP